MRNNIVIFGLAIEGEHAYEYMKKNNEIIAFCDNDIKKHGATYLGKPIISPRELQCLGDDLVVVVANKKYEMSISYQLVSIGLKNVFIYNNANNQPLSKVPQELSELFSPMMTECYLKYEHLDFFEVETHASTYNVKKSRVFNFTFFNYGGECGGPAGVMFRLCRANRILHAIDNDFYIFGDKAILPAGSDKSPPSDIHDKGDIFYAISKLWGAYLSRQPSHNEVRLLDDRLIWMQRYINRVVSLNKKICFSPSDTYIFHDIESAFIFLHLFPYLQTALVHHAQGSMYYEYLVCGGKPSEGLEITWNLMHQDCLSKVKRVVFPSWGGYDSLVKTAPNLRDLCISPSIILNGVNINHFSASNEIKHLIDGFICSDTITFATIATINDAKAIERIPKILGHVKHNGKMKVQWILVGSGQNEHQVEDCIKKYGLEEDTLWIKEKKSHDDIQYILDVCDYYIILQKYSICDFATIEAMGRGCIPILSNTLGNAAYLSYNNGFAVSDYNDARELIHFLSSSDKKQLSKLNVSVQGDCFSDNSFLSGYSKLVYDLNR